MTLLLQTLRGKEFKGCPVLIMVYPLIKSHVGIISNLFSNYWDIPCAECGDELYSQFCDYGTEDIYRAPEVCAKCGQHARDELSELTHRNYIEQYGERTRNVLPDTLF